MKSYTDINHLTNPYDPGRSSSVRQSYRPGKPSKVQLITLAVLMVGVVTGLILTRSPQILQRFAAETAPTPVLVCRETDAYCKIPPDDLARLIQSKLYWEFVIEKSGSEIARSSRSQSEIFMPSILLDQPPYTCKLDLFYNLTDRLPIEDVACKPSVIADGLQCKNCSCSLMGNLLIHTLTAEQNTGKPLYRTEWKPNIPLPPQCKEVTGACERIYVYTSDHDGNRVEVQPPSSYACNIVPHPAVDIHQDNKGRPRVYTFVVADSNGNLSNELACRPEKTFSCEDVGGCGLLDIGTCDPRMCDFEVTGTDRNGNPIGKDELRNKACLDPTKAIKLLVQPDGPVDVDFDDDADGVNIHSFNPPNEVTHTYYDHGIYKIKVTCKEVGYTCEKVLKMGCGPGVIDTPTPSPTTRPSPSPTSTPPPSPSPSPTPQACPVVSPISLQFELSCQGCRSTPTPIP